MGATVPINEKIESLEDVIRYIYHHEGRIDQLWEMQMKLNNHNGRRLDAITARVTAAEKRMILFAFGAAAAGSAAPDVIQRLLALLGG